MANGPLVLVDLQPAYLMTIDAEYERIFNAVRQAITQARAAKRPIIVVEMAHQAGTHQQIMDLLAGYDKTFKIEKKDLSGAAQIKAECDKRGYLPEVFSLGGVAAAVCVYDTALGLAAAYPNSRIEILKDLCDTPFLGWDAIRHPRIFKIRRWHTPTVTHSGLSTTTTGETNDRA